MRAVVLAVAAIALLAVNPSYAQSAPSAGAKSPPALVDPIRLAAAREMLNASRVVRNARVGAVIGFETGFDASIRKSGIAEDQELTEAIRKASLGELEKAFNVLLPQMIEDLALSYAQKMTIEEMKAATVFYRSPAGEKLLDLMPGMTAEANNKMQERLAPYLPKVEEAAKQAVVEVLSRRPQKGSPL